MIALSERVIVDGLGCHTALHFGVKAKENQDKVPTLYWLPKLHKNPIKQDLLLILYLTPVKTQLLQYNISSNGCHYGPIFFKPEKNLEFFRLKNWPIDGYPGRLE